MFKHRNVTPLDFTRGEDVWAVVDGQVRRAEVEEIFTTVRVGLEDGQSVWVAATALFKRPAEYHILQSEVAAMIEDLRSSVETAELLGCGT